MGAKRRNVKFLTEFPNIFQEWNSEKNEIDPETLKAGSTIRVWWKCHSCSYEWPTRVYKRCVNGTGCPECAKIKRGQKRSKPKSGNSLQETYPDVAKFWDYEANYPLTPLDVTPKSNKEYWWKCDKGDDHKWPRKVVNATKSGKCPACSGKMVVKGNSLLDLYPESMKYWSSENPQKYHPSKIRPGSNIRLIWQCEEAEDHVWDLKVHAFLKGGISCPFCDKKRPSSTHNLQLKYPEVCEEWDYSKNDTLPTEYTPYSDKSVYWKCSKDSAHSWPAAIASRTRIGAGCPYCAGVRVEEKHSLFYTHPELEKQWNYEKNEGFCFSDGRQITPKTVSSGSSKKVWWKCEKGDDHVWPAVINTRRTHGCPICSNQLAVKSNCLETTRPDLAKQWHHELNKDLLFANGTKITPKTVTDGSNKTVWWRCEKDGEHIWPAIINTRRNHGCPICAGQIITSSNSLAKTHPEYAAQWDFELNDEIIRANGKNVNPWNVSAGSNVKVNWKCLDVEKHKWPAVISSRTKQNHQCPYCVGTKTPPEKSLKALFPEISSQWHPTKNSNLFNVQGELVKPEHLSPNSHISVWWKCEEVDDHEWKMTIRSRTNDGAGCQCCRGRVVVSSNRLSTTHPELAIQWDLTKNDGLTPDDVTASTTMRVYWKCDKGPDHEWDSLLPSRVRGVGCPCCTGKKAVPSNSIATTHPELLEQWDYKKNSLTPLMVTAGSGKTIWWRCDKGDDHTWHSTVANRVAGNGCPVCMNKKITDSNSLYKLRPDLMKEWDWIKNTKTPHELSVGSSQHVWWICSVCSNSWKAPPARRTGRDQSGCQDCAEYGLRPSDPCSIYFLRYSGPLGTWYKIGITSNFYRRLSELESALRKTKMFFDHHIDVEFCLDMGTAREARVIEKSIIENYDPPDFIFDRFDGSTEFVSEYLNLEQYVNTLG